MTGHEVNHTPLGAEDGEMWVFMTDREGTRAINAKIIERILVANPVKQSL